MSHRDHLAQSRRSAGHRETDAAPCGAGVNIHDLAEPCAVDRIHAADVEHERCGPPVEKRAGRRCKGD